MPGRQSDDDYAREAIERVIGAVRNLMYGGGLAHVVPVSAMDEAERLLGEAEVLASKIDRPLRRSEEET